MPRQRSPFSFPTQPIPREEEYLPRGGKYPKGCASAYVLGFLATSLINKSELIFKCAKILNVFTCGEETSKLAV